MPPSARVCGTRLGQLRLLILAPGALLLLALPSVVCAQSVTSQPATSAATDDWPMFRGNVRLTGVARCTLGGDLQRLWTFPAGEAVSSSAAIVDDTVFVGSEDGNLHALNLASGQPKWKFAAGNPIHSSPTVHRGTVYFGDEAGVFFALDAATGREKWRLTTDAEIISGATCDGPRIYFGSYDQFVRCLSADGKEIWKFETAGKVHATPALADGRLLVSGCDGLLRTLDAPTGKSLAELSLGSYTGASPAILDQRCFLGTYGERVLGVDWRDGRILWEYEHPQRKFPYLSSAAVADGVAVVGGRDKIVRALDVETGQPLWEYATGGRVDSSPAIAGRRAYVGSGDGTLYAFELRSGKIEWRFECGGAINASPAIARQRLVVGDELGTVHCFGPRP
ncbi:MAG: Outer membrane protein assembly factor BamB [Phycisphaerae bacterium]|nr:Outer membrane protein assembly factor BamB [Phycisphaerae bacterium]